MGTPRARLVAGLLAIGLMAASVYSYLSWTRSQEQLLGVLEEFGIGAREPGVVSDVRREPDAVRAQLLVARALLADELDRRWLADLDDGEREAAEALSLQKLDVAGTMAGQVLGERPASWQARMILAGATYLKMSRKGDPKRWRERERWERPLRDAMAMATSQVEPRRILAAAYLNDWSLMTDDERRSARNVLRVAFRDRATLEQLLPAWLRRAETLDQALDLIPADSSSWQHVEQYFRVRQDWERVCEARTRSLSVVSGYLDGVLADAEKRLAGGDTRQARSLALHALTTLPVGPAHRQTLDRLFRVLPPGPIPEQHQRYTRKWLAWVRRECLLGNCPLSKTIIQRLRTLSQYETSAERAWAAELAGDTYAAESLARAAFLPGTPEWASYLLLKAKHSATSGKADEAAVFLAQVPEEWAERAVTKSVRELVRKDLGASSQSRAGIWQSPSILRLGETSFREYLWQEPPEKIRLRFEVVASAGAAIEILWSDRWEGCYRIDSGAVLTLEPPASSGYHVLEVRPLVGTRAGLTDIQIIPETRFVRPAPQTSPLPG